MSKDHVLEVKETLTIVPRFGQRVIARTMGFFLPFA